MHLLRLGYGNIDYKCILNHDTIKNELVQIIHNAPNKKITFSYVKINGRYLRNSNKMLTLLNQHSEALSKFMRNVCDSHNSLLISEPLQHVFVFSEITFWRKFFPLDETVHCLCKVRCWTNGNMENFEKISFRSRYHCRH